jgi:hypothetical protein
MAIVGTQDDDENKNVIAQPTTSSSPNAHAAWDSASGTPYQGASGGTGLVGGAGTGSGQGVSTGPAPSGSTSPNPGGGGGFTNLSQYLAVNQGSGGTTGQAAGNVVTQSADAAKGAQGAYNTAATADINAATTAAGQQQGVFDKIGAGTQNVDQGTLDKINAGGYTYAPQASFSLAGLPTESKENLDKSIQAGADASKWSYGGPTDFSKVQYGGPSIDQITTQYGGPSTVADFQGDTAGKQAGALAANETVAGNSANAKGGQTGVSALLRQAYQQPNYSKGENNLDAFLAGGTTGGQEALGKAAGMGDDVSKSYAGIQSALGTAIQGGKDTATATNKAYLDAIGKGTATSKATQDKYNAQVDATKKASAEAQAKALADAKAAQDEEDARAKAAAAAAEKAKQEAPPPPPPPITGNATVDNIIRKTGTAVENVAKPVGNDITNLGKNILNTPSNVGRDLAGVLKGDQGAINNTATTVLTGGLNKVAPASTAATIAAAAKARDDIAAATKKAADDAAAKAKAVAAPVTKTVSNIVNSIKKPHWAHGGEVQPRSYGSLISKLRGHK